MKTQIMFRYLKAAAFIILCIFQIRFGVIPAWNEVHSDFPNYYTSSRLLLEGRNISDIYNDSWFQNEIHSHGINEQGKFSPFPPPAVLIMTPVARLEPLTAKRVYLAFSIILLTFTAFLVKKISGLTYLGACNLILFSGAALSNNLLLGQFYLILLTLILWGYRLFLNNGGIYSGVLWGIGAAMKYFPIIFIPVILFKKDWKTLFPMILTIIFINSVTFIIIGWEPYSEFFQKVFIPHMNGELSSQSAYAVSFQSWNSFFRNIFVYDRFENISPVFNSLEAFYAARAAVYLVFTAITLLVLFRLRKSSEITSYSVIIFTFWAFVLSPASASYHLLLLILPIVLLIKISSGMPHKYSIFFNILYAITGFSPFLQGRFENISSGLFLAYGRLWLTVILYFSSVWFILIHSRKIKAEDHYLLSTVPNAGPSSIGS